MRSPIPRLDMPTQPLYTITDLAREFQVTQRAIRFYEDQGLLFPARQGRNRVYSRHDRTRLKLALRGRRLGLSVAEIRELLDLYYSSRDEKTQLEKFLVILADRRRALEQQREDIEALLAEVVGLEGRCRTLLTHGAGDTLDRHSLRPADGQDAAGTPDDLPV